MLSVRKATENDLARIMEIYRNAQEFMIRSGNPDQWGHTYPQPELIASDIQLGACHVIYDEQDIHGVFALFEGEDPTYKQIYDGKWLNDDVYIAVHRVAGDGKVHGILRRLLEHCEGICSNIRIDTHQKNLVMQERLKRNGFVPCGIIYLENGAARIAFQRAM